MARSRKYGWNGEMPGRELSGQALIVFNGMKTLPDTMATGKEWTEVIGPELKTRQDPYRVVLYYILILKNLGVVKTEESDINAVTKDAESGTKHPVTVKSTAAVVAGAPVLEHADQPIDIGPQDDPDGDDEDVQDTILAAEDLEHADANE